MNCGYVSFFFRPLFIAIKFYEFILTNSWEGWWCSQEQSCWSPPATFYSEAASNLWLTQQLQHLHCCSLTAEPIILFLFLLSALATCKDPTSTHTVSVTQLWSPSSLLVSLSHLDNNTASKTDSFRRLLNFEPFRGDAPYQQPDATGTCCLFCRCLRCRSDYTEWAMAFALCYDHADWLNCI